MSLDKLDYFISVAENKSFTIAATECNVVQSTISKQISSLEMELKCSLFSRYGNTVKLTKQGERFYKDAKVLNNIYRTAIKHSRAVAHKNMDYKLNIGIAGVQLNTGFLDIFNNLKALYPELEIKLLHCDIKNGLIALKTGFFDAILCYHRPEYEKDCFEYLELGNKKLKFFVSKEDFIFGDRKFGLDDLFTEFHNIYMSYEVLQRILKDKRLGSIEKSKIKLIEGEFIIPTLSTLRKSAVICIDEGYTEQFFQDNVMGYAIINNYIEFKEILLYEKQSSNKTLIDLRRCILQKNINNII